MNDVKLHLRNALVDHSYPFSGRRRDIDCAATNERTAVIDTNNDRTAIGNVGNAQSRAEWQCGMSGGQFVGIEFFAARSLKILPVEAGKRVRCTLYSSRPCLRSEMPVRIGERHRLCRLAPCKAVLLVTLERTERTPSGLLPT